MGSAADDGEGWRLIWPSLQGIPWGEPGRPFVPHGFQLGGRRRYQALGAVGVPNGVRSIVTWGDDSGISGFSMNMMGWLRRTRWRGWRGCSASSQFSSTGLSSMQM